MTAREDGQVARIDPASRRVLSRFALVLMWFTAVAFAPCLAGIVKPAEAVTSLGTYCAVAALLRMFLAARRRETPCAAYLNSWDECLALAGSALFAYSAGWLLR